MPLPASQPSAASHAAPMPVPAAMALPPWSAVARLQQVGSVARWGSALALLVWGWVSPTVSAGWALLPVGLMPLVLGLQMAMAHAVNRREVRAGRAPGQCPITWGGSWRAWCSEVVAAERVFGWRQPWGWRAHPNAGPLSTPCRAPASQPQRGVLLVHGYLCNRGLWNRWLPVLQRRGHATVAVNLAPVWGSIDDYAPTIEAAVRHLTQATGMAPLVVCHSMGGLAVRAWMRAFPGADTRVAHVVTIGTPHQGTWLAQWGQGQNVWQMRQKNAWLNALAQAEPPQRSQQFTCWHSCGDNIVFPLGTAVLPGAAAQYLPHVGHVALVDHPAIMVQVLQRLQPLG